MKLYEFTYCDNQKLPERSLMTRIEEFLQKESIEQGWASDYKYRQIRAVETLPSGERQYFFEVVGTLSEDKNDGWEKSEVNLPVEDALAAKEISP